MRRREQIHRGEEANGCKRADRLPAEADQLLIDGQSGVLVLVVLHPDGAIATALLDLPALSRLLPLAPIGPAPPHRCRRHRRHGRHRRSPAQCRRTRRLHVQPIIPRQQRRCLVVARRRRVGGWCRARPGLRRRWCGARIENGFAERGRIGPTLLVFLRKRARDRVREPGRRIRPQHREWTRRLRHVLHEHRRRVRCLERRFAGKQLIADHAERIDVAPAIKLAFAERLLGRHVRRRADRDAGDGEPRVALRGARDAEIRHHRTARRPIEHDVVRLHVAMHDALRVRICQRIGHTREQPPRFADRQPWLAHQTLREALSVNERHDEVDDAFSLVHGVDRDDAGVGELRRGLRLAQKALAHIRVEGEFRREHLDRDTAIQTQIGRAIHDRHPAPPDLRVDEILRPDRDQQAVEQWIVHPRSDARLGLDVARPRRPISSATNSASSTLSAIRIA